MTVAQTEKASRLLDEIRKLKKYKLFIDHKEHKDVAHFAIHEHYGDRGAVIDFDNRHNDKFIKVLDEIIEGLEKEFEEL